MFERNAGVEIRKVENGYLVMPPSDIRSGNFQPIERSLVFQSLAAMVEWLGQHFTHRAQNIRED